MTYWLQHYVVDWDKVQTLDDLKAIMRAVNPAFEPYDDINAIRHLLRLEQKPHITLS